MCNLYVHCPYTILRTLNNKTMHKEYKIVNGTAYYAETNDEVINVLEKVRKNATRIIIDYGDPKTGKSWNETFDTTGYVGRSCGSVKIPILLYNNRSMGGTGMLTHCIIGIKTSKGKRVLYSL